MSNKPNLKHAPKTGSPGAEHKRRSWWASPIVWVAAVAVVAIVVTLAISAGSGDDSADTVEGVQETAFAEILGAPLPELAQTDTAVGAPDPRMSAQTFDGRRTQIGGDGVARLYGFFAHWCPHCQAELPRVTAWLEENELPPGVEIVAVSTAVDETADNYPPSAWFAREGWPELVVVDDVDSPLALGYGLSGFPFWVAVDADGAVVQRVSGELDTAGFERMLELVTPAAG